MSTTHSNEVTEDELIYRSERPRVTLEQLEANIVSEHYFTAGDALRGDVGEADSLNRLTFCVLVLKNGFTVTGQSACADPGNFKKDIGERLAKKDAIGQVWGFMGYELSTKLRLIEEGTPPSKAGGKTYVGTKVVHAYPMDRLAYNILRGWKLPYDENGSDEGYLVEYADGGEGNVEGYTGYVSWSPRDVFERAYQTL